MEDNKDKTNISVADHVVIRDQNGKVLYKGRGNQKKPSKDKKDV